MLHVRHSLVAGLLCMLVLVSGAVLAAVDSRLATSTTQPGGGAAVPAGAGGCNTVNALHASIKQE
jgi:hypothetical protein